ncbi:substrate-binding periplasmic protein [Corallincola spongiicola]|uniref:Transporter substrate-binding domain-containing protein n=1 Tax=Corallincola spongiicola TaxID=2520508 RepID=A0ABY1WT48_9GAMM|nr:transporter substrate-binding domain-containing protein [Corallincola spongiicola]TAA47892.1 transporter substrate-binding domain-containing protein [Corallincola spongiicola]
MQLVNFSPYKLALLLTFLASGIAESAAGSKLKSPVQQGIIQLGVQDFPFYAPYSLWEKDSYQGFNRELFDLFASYLNKQIRYQPYSVKRRTLTLISGESALIYPDNPQWAPEAKKSNKIYYSQPVTSYIDGVMVTPSQQAMTLPSLKRLGILLGFTPVPYQAMIDRGDIEIHTDANIGVLINMVISGALDGVYLNTAVTKQYLQQIIAKPNALVVAEQLPLIRSSRHLSTAHYPGLIASFDKFLKTHQQSVNALKQKYGLPHNN